MDVRQQQYHEISSHLARLSDPEMRALIDNRNSKDSSTGWGTHQTLIVENTKVFLKRIPVTKLEYDNLFSTGNLYQLPTFCNYGFGSPGTNVFRELITQIKTTHWVLQGETVHFPLLYHYRLLPFSSTWPELSSESHQSMIEAWGSNENLSNYVLERAKAPYELVLCLEHVPYALESWLRDNPYRLTECLQGIQAALAFLRSRGIIHFDAHFGNILTDGKQAYLTDFGLALDQNFALSEAERNFFDQHRDYDSGEVLRNLGRMILWAYVSRSEADQQTIRERYGVAENVPLHQLGPVLLDHIQSLHVEKLLDLNPFYVNLVVKYRSAIGVAHNFFAEMWDNNAKDTAFPHLHLRHLLETTPFLPEVDSAGILVPDSVQRIR